MTGAQPARADFWRFSISFYGDPQVAEACLRLQDEFGADVNMVLFLLWQASAHRTVSAAEIRALESAVRGWREEVVAPLRSVRRWLKHCPENFDPDRTHRLRQEVKRIELESERLQQEGMEKLAGQLAVGATASSEVAAANASIAAYEEVHGRKLADSAVGILLQKFAGHGTTGPGRR